MIVAALGGLVLAVIGLPVVVAELVRLNAERARAEDDRPSGDVPRIPRGMFPEHGPVDNS